MLALLVLNLYREPTPHRPTGLPTWDSRALLHSDHRKRRHKLSLVRSLMANGSVLCLQEVHGTEAELRAALFHLNTHHLLFSSPHPNHAAGGVAMVVPVHRLPHDGPRGLRRRELVCQHTILAPGRAHRLYAQYVSDVEQLPHMLIVHNIQNFDLSQQQMDEIASAIRFDVNTAKSGPQRFTIMIMGGFAFLSRATIASSYCSY